MGAVAVHGRERELAALGEFLDGPVGALVLEGGPGIGKTTLWEAGVALARERGLRVLLARCGAGDTRPALAELLDGVAPRELEPVPSPQRRALLRGGEPQAVATGLLSALRALAPLLVAIDDAQWLDPESAAALVFAARRLGDRPVGFLLATRGPVPIGRARRLALGPLSLEAIRRLLAARLELVLPRRVLRRVYDAAAGNPLFALELGREVAERGAPAPGEHMALPASLDDLLGARVERLPVAQRRLLVALALAPGARVAQLQAIAGESAVDAALDAGILLASGDGMRAANPLLAAAAAGRSPPGERRELHLAHARESTGEQQRVLQLALAADGPDAVLAARLDAAAAAAAAGDAVALARHALRLTAPDAPERPARLLALGDRLEAAGEPQQLTDLLAPEVDALPPGEPRVRAHLLLAEGGHVRHADQHAAHLERALDAAGGDPALRAPVLALQSIHASVTCVAGIPHAEALAREAAAPGALAWARALRGHAFEPGGEPDVPVDRSVARVAAVRLVWRGETTAARAALTELLATADERGETWSYLVARLHLCELELRTGRWDTVSRLLDEWAESSDGSQFQGLVYERCRALLAAGRGDHAEAARRADEAIAGARATGIRWQELEALRARGVAALLAHEPETAAGALRTVWEATEREGVEDPGAFPVAPDLVEALVELGRDDEARAVADRLDRLATSQRHPWGLASATRCDALLAGLEPEDGYGPLGLPFDRARTLLVLGRAARRRRHWGAARSALETAAGAFAALGSPGWEADARAELARVGGRPAPPPGELTPSEQRVVKLAVGGMANKEIARTLGVGVHTVEVHLSRAYAKLGVHSRTQLRGALG